MKGDVALRPPVSISTEELDDVDVEGSQQRELTNVTMSDTETCAGKGTRFIFMKEPGGGFTEHIQVKIE